MSRAQLTSTVEQNTGGAVAPFVAGKNFLANGGFDIWQRGTSSVNPSANTLLADRWYMYFNAGAATFSQETSNVPTGYRYAMKIAQSSASALQLLQQTIETSACLAFAGQNITASALVATSTGTVPVTLDVQYSTSADAGIGGTYTSATSVASGTNTASTTYSKAWNTVSIPSTAKSILFRMLANPVPAGTSFYITGIQLEIGSVATPFSRAGGTLQGELALCQRYFTSIASNSSAVYTYYGNGFFYGSTGAKLFFSLPVTMRTNPSLSLVNPTSMQLQYNNTNQGVVASGTGLDQSNGQTVGMFVNVSSGVSVGTACIMTSNAANTAIQLSAEL